MAEDRGEEFYTGFAEERPNNVGILALEVYFPQRYVLQAELERADGVEPGKYTKGLGQHAMTVVGDREDVNSMALSVTSYLLDKYNVDPTEVGRVEVGTETIVDHSKSTKTVLMHLFPCNGDIEGATVLNACYGGTAALFNSVAWIESRSWDGRLAMVIATDIAVYESGPSRPTGGCGAVAMLVGPNAPLAFEAAPRATLSRHVWDFFKPHLFSEYAEVDGPVSNLCYLTALSKCYLTLASKVESIARRRTKRFDSKKASKPDSKVKGDATAKTVEECHSDSCVSSQSTEGPPSTAQIDPSAAATKSKFGSTVDPLGVAEFGLHVFDYCVFHSPYNKLVQKAFARLLFLDLVRSGKIKEVPSLRKWANASLEGAVRLVSDRDLDLRMRHLTEDLFLQKVEPSCAFGRETGNSYAASLYCALLSLVCEVEEGLVDKRLLMFSYGSGMISSLFTLRGRNPVAGVHQGGRRNGVWNATDGPWRLNNRATHRADKRMTNCAMVEESSGVAGGYASTRGAEARFTLSKITETVNLRARLATRTYCSAEEFERLLKMREDLSSRILQVRSSLSHTAGDTATGSKEGETGAETLTCAVKNSLMFTGNELPVDPSLEQNDPWTLSNVSQRTKETGTPHVDIFVPVDCIHTIAPDAYYLCSITAQLHRVYAKKGEEHEQPVLHKKMSS